MRSLLKCEFKKFKSTYINSLSFLGMLVPLFLVGVMFLIKKNDFVRAGSYTWMNFYKQLAMFFIFLVGPIITSFISVFSVFYEYQQKTLKNMLSSPHGRVKMILVKMIYISVFVLLQYALVTVLSVLIGLGLGFKINFQQFLDCSSALMAAGLSTLIMVPLMMFITLLCKSFIPSMVITVIGTISNVLTLNWDKSYLSPWATPVDFTFILAGQAEMNILYPILSTCTYFIIFMVVTLLYFRNADQSV